MKQNFIVALFILCVATTQAEDVVYELDMSDDSIAYNENSVWTGIYGNESFVADGFVFSHVAPYGPGYYEGFLPSRNTDNANHYDASGWTANQWGCMAQGGVNLESGKVFNAEAIVGKPFMISYFSAYSLAEGGYGTSFITTSDNSTFMPQGVYVCNTPWGYYGCTEGDGFATPLTTAGDYYKITFHGVRIANGTTNSVDFYLAQCEREDINADGIINEGDNYVIDHWAWCDLSQLGAVDVLYISMDSSDKGDYGMNTSTVVCLDGLSAVVSNAVNATINNNSHIYAANGRIYMKLDQAQTIRIYNTLGVLTSTHDVNAGAQIIDASHLAHGTYLVHYQGGVAKVIL